MSNIKSSTFFMYFKDNFSVKQKQDPQGKQNFEFSKCRSIRVNSCFKIKVNLDRIEEYGDKIYKQWWTFV